jgi:hypothetical protein
MLKALVPLLNIRGDAKGKTIRLYDSDLNSFHQSSLVTPKRWEKYIFCLAESNKVYEILRRHGMRPTL